MDTQDVDMVIVGAGLSGIAAARFYLEVHPECRLVILEQDRSPGGVWNSRRSYEEFWTQWTVGTAEWSDLRMPRPPEDDLYYDFFKAKDTSNYVENYVDHHRFANQSLRDRIRFGFKVNTIQKPGNVWVVTGDTAVFRASKIIVASGLTSTPNMPDLPGIDRFEAPVIHQESYGQSSVLSSAKFQNVTVIGGGKSAADMVYSSVKAGKSVSWIIRASGTGPAFFVSPKGKGPYKNAFQIGSTRIVSTLSPSILNPETLWTRFVHGTNLGQKIVHAIWGAVDKETRADAGFDGRRDALEGFANLEPLAPQPGFTQVGLRHHRLFWQNGTAGLLNRADFWETVAPNVHIYLDDILELDKNLIRLKRGDEVASDVLLCGTGWDAASFDFFQPDHLVRLGLPHLFKDEPSDESQLWARLEQHADAEILRKFPTLANPPDHFHRPSPTTPYRLYNGMAPLHDDSIAFIGYSVVTNYFQGAECQAIWATAFLDHVLALPSSTQDKRADIATMVAYNKRRYLSSGERGNSLAFESNFYLDKLLREVGLSSHLKGWFGNYFVPRTARDLAGLKDEYLAKYGGGKGEH